MAPLKIPVGISDFKSCAKTAIIILMLANFFDIRKKPESFTGLQIESRPDR